VLLAEYPMQSMGPITPPREDLMLGHESWQAPVQQLKRKFDDMV
jgi:hypothetical protein